VELFWQGSLPEEAPQGVFLFVHGLGEHSDRYAHVAERLGAAGFAAFAFDLRGHGRSGGRRGHVVTFRDYLADVEAVRGETARHFPGLPLYLLGHSLGGLITLRYLLERGEGVAAAVISSPYLGDLPELAPPKALDLLARGLSRLYPILPFKTGIRPALVSRDPEVVRAYREDPRIFDRVTPRFYTETRRALERVHGAAAAWRVPLLLMQSGADRLVDPAATRRWAEAAPAETVEFVEWEGFYHEMFNEPAEDRERVFQRIETWLACARLPA
jgi:alpha-beta hydrolase superfamily lysophospholipase